MSIEEVFITCRHCFDRSSHQEPSPLLHLSNLGYSGYLHAGHEPEIEQKVYCPLGLDTCNRYCRHALLVPRRLLFADASLLNIFILIDFQSMILNPAYLSPAFIKGLFNQVTKSSQPFSYLIDLRVLCQ